MTSMATPADALFRERRRVPVWWWAVALVIAVPSVEIVTVFAPEMTSHGGWLLALGVGIVTIGLVAALLLSISRSDVAVDATGLRVDRQLLPATAIGRVRVLGQLTMRDVLGRETTQNLALFTDKGLLAPGREAFAVDFGFRRTFYGLTSFGYDDPLLSGDWRRGLSQSFTIEAHGEAAPRQIFEAIQIRYRPPATFSPR